MAHCVALRVKFYIYFTLILLDILVLNDFSIHILLVYCSSVLLKTISVVALSVKIWLKTISVVALSVKILLKTISVVALSVKILYVIFR